MNLCALDKRTGKFITPRLAERYDDNGAKNTFSCVDPSCNGDLKLRKCGARIDHFAHITVGGCSKYSRAVRLESEEHLEAKRQLKMVFENGFNISIKRTCPYNNKCSKTIVIPPISDSVTIDIEYHFNFNGGSKYADVVYLDNGAIKYIFEIYNTSETHEYNRPDPWFEIDAKSLLNIVEDVKPDKNLIFFCIRRVNCSKCIKEKSESEEREERRLEEKKQCNYRAEKIRLKLIADEKEKLERIAKNEAEQRRLNSCRMCDFHNHKDTWNKYHCTNTACDCFIVRQKYCYTCGDKKYGRGATRHTTS